jgi:hypothetical protein
LLRPPEDVFKKIARLREKRARPPPKATAKTNGEDAALKPAPLHLSLNATGSKRRPPERRPVRAKQNASPDGFSPSLVVPLGYAARRDVSSMP